MKKIQQHPERMLFSGYAKHAKVTEVVVVDDEELFGHGKQTPTFPLTATMDSMNVLNVALNLITATDKSHDFDVPFPNADVRRGEYLLYTSGIAASVKAKLKANYFDDEPGLALRWRTISICDIAVLSTEIEKYRHALIRRWAEVVTEVASWSEYYVRVLVSSLSHAKSKSAVGIQENGVRVPLVIAGEHQSSLCAVIPLRLEIDKELFWYLYLRPAHLLEHTHTVRIN
ncbi:hypothetical protein EV421DRAFT_1738297 [Armillaria borealis]|uniref:Uncharacterized protein n=1 Tax=Armillaria borealis TaxID=47425 RepID=A0AA39JA34_9AGAR|nr:hypothetical protein EV421DRAFT_1738297 [Armillaria borealis]